MSRIDLRNKFYSQPKEVIESLKPGDPVKFYRLLKTGQTVCEILVLEWVHHYYSI